MSNAANADSKGGLVGRAPSALAPGLTLTPAEEILVGQGNPVLSYLARLSDGSRRTIRGSHREEPEGQGRVHLDALSFPWWQLTSTHTAIIRDYLAGK